MKSYGLLCTLVLISLVLCPVAAIKPAAEAPQVVGEAENEDVINVFASASGKIEGIEMHEYLIGVLACEMSPQYHTEALKAQAAASYTYALRTRIEQQKSPDSSLLGADISDSSQTHQGYITMQARQELWGDKFEEYEAKLEGAVFEVYGSKIMYNGEPILALYHAICAGRTQSAQSMWGTEIPYLQSVESPGDMLSPDYSESVYFSDSDFKKLLKESGIALIGDAEEWLGKIKRDESDYVLSVELCGKEIAANKFRETLNIRSTCFTVERSKNGFTVVTSGYGHGVGMSQYGADYMARQGSTWREIIAHYYCGTTVS